MIAVLGAGTWGTALAIVLAKNCPQENIWFWGRHNYINYFPDITLPSNIEFTTDLFAVIKQSSDLLITVPSSGFSDLIDQIKPYIDLKQHRISWATKGMDAVTNKFFSQIVTALLGEDLPIAVLSGPSFATEVIHGLPTAVVVACHEKDQLFANDLIKKLNCKTFRVYINNDLIGVQLGGVFKNVLAVATGICDGLSFGANTRAALITRGLAEVLRLADKLGAKSQTLMGLSGVGDIFLTCSDNQSRNRRFGMLLATGITIEQAKTEIGQAIEALNNIETLYRLAMYHKIDMPIVVSTWQILHQEISLRQAVEDLLIRDPQVEYI